MLLYVVVAYSTSAGAFHECVRPTWDNAPERSARHTGRPTETKPVSAGMGALHGMHLVRTYYGWSSCRYRLQALWHVAIRRLPFACP